MVITHKDNNHDNYDNYYTHSYYDHNHHKFKFIYKLATMSIIVLPLYAKPNLGGLRGLQPRATQFLGPLELSG